MLRLVTRFTSNWLVMFARFCWRMLRRYMVLCCILDMGAYVLRLGSFVLLITIASHSLQNKAITLPFGMLLDVDSSRSAFFAGTVFIFLYGLSSLALYHSEQVGLRASEIYVHKLNESRCRKKVHAYGTAVLALIRLCNRSAVAVVSLSFAALLAPLIVLPTIALVGISLLLLRNLVRLSPRDDNKSENAHELGAAKNKLVLWSSIVNAVVIAAMFVGFISFREVANIEVHHALLCIIGLRLALVSCQAAFINVQRLYRMRRIITAEREAYALAEAGR